jgi:hypothetical protein
VLPPPSRRYCIVWGPELVEIGTEVEGSGGVRRKLVLGFGRTEIEILTNLMRQRTSDEDLARVARIGKTKFAEETIASLGLPDDEVEKMARELLAEIKAMPPVPAPVPIPKLQSFGILKALHPEAPPAAILAWLARTAHNVAKTLDIELCDRAIMEKRLREIAESLGLDAVETDDAIRATFPNVPVPEQP